MYHGHSFRKSHTHTHSNQQKNRFVWFSEEWTHTLVEVKFLDTISGDSLVALRNNKGGTLSTGPTEHFVSVHPRIIQTMAYEGASTYDMLYGTAEDRNARQTLFKESSASEVQGFDSSRLQILGITDMLVLPTGKGDGRQPWVLLSVVVATRDETPQGAPTTQDEFETVDQRYTSFAESYRQDICINLNLDVFVGFVGAFFF